METAVRRYRFALRPTLAQAKAITHAQKRARRLWNEMCALLRWAEREQRNGRREALLVEYGRILAGKKIMGLALAQARKLVAEGTYSNVETACAAVRANKVETAKRWGRRRVAAAYAIERSQANARSKRAMPSSSTGLAIVQRFHNACQRYITGKSGRPRFATKEKIVSIQYQLNPTSAAPADFSGCTVNLSGPLDNRCCRRIVAIFHRQLPEGSKIKQVTIIASNTRSFVSFAIEAPSATFARDTSEIDTATVAGIDPGRKTALTVSDTTGATQFVIQPPLFRDTRFLRRHNRLQRRADRQLRAANPERFDEKGRWKKRAGSLTLTQGLRETRARIAEGLRHIADARREAYHLGANQLLRDFSVVGVGNWRGRGKAPGVGKSKRAQNRKDYDNALGEFVAILKDKAARCSQPRTVLDIREAGTTKHCPDCGEATGPSGLKDLRVRAWTCSACGLNHQRDFASARAIAKRAQQTAAGAHPAQPEVKASKPAVASTKVRERKARAKSPLPRNQHPKKRERRSGVSAAEVPHRKPAAGVEVVAKLAPCSQPPVHQQMELPLAIQDASFLLRNGSV